ncbi:replication initiation protein (plasmid) [Bacteroides ovatus]|nr:replication initiation protein [Bacteroides ovatus]
MATNDITLYIPPTEEEVMLIQPNNVTFGQYSVTEWQENLLTLISDQIQQHMTREKQLPKDLFNQPVVEIKCDEAGGKNNKSKVLKEAIAMMRKNFSFRWVHPNIHQTVETFGVVITTVHNIKGTNRVALTLNPWAIPFLLYYGTGVGGTRYGKNIALTLRGNYTKRLYKIICSQRDRREYYYSIDQFCKDLEIPASYSNAQIDQKVLRPAQTRIKESEADVWFDYKFICKTPKKGQKPKADTIILFIHARNPQELRGDQQQQYSFVYRWVYGALSYPSDNTPVRALDKILESGRLKDVYDRCAYYDDKVCSGEMSTAHAQNSLAKMLREDFGIKARGEKERSRPVWLNPEDFLYLCAAGVVPVRLGADGYCTSSLKSGAN